MGALTAAVQSMMECTARDWGLAAGCSRLLAPSSDAMRLASGTPVQGQGRTSVGSIRQSDAVGARETALACD
jgi:hypothetical protein